MTATSTKTVTADQLLDMRDVGRCELIGGEVVVIAPSGIEHGDIAGQLLFLLKSFVDRKKLGRVLAAETGFRIARNHDTVRAPDVAFVRKGRWPRRRHTGFFPGAPDLAIEVLSPSDRWSDVIAKVNAWLGAGAISVWVVDPANRSIDIYRGGNQVFRYKRPDAIRDEPTLPGFVLRLSDLFGGTADRGESDP
jgi:Uma2 family endonuclease